MLGQLVGVEWGGRGVRGNTVCPGQVRTPMTEAMFKDPEIAEGRAAVVPMGRVGEAAEAGDVIAFLCSDVASYVTGTAINVDGGTSPVV